MQTSLKAIVTGAVVAGAVALATGAANPAAARGDDTHTLLVQLPNGAIEQIEYTGPVAPRIVLTPSAARPAFNQFAAFDQIAALMDQQAAAMLQQVASMPGWNGAAPALPPGVSGTSTVITVSNGHACTRSTEVRYDGQAAQPHVVSNVSGDCGAGAALEQTVPAEQQAPAEPTVQPHTIRVKANGPALHHGLVQEAFYQHKTE